MRSKYPLHRWLALTLFFVWSMTLCPGVTHANGGAIVLVEMAGAYYLRVTASPYPHQVGLNDISLLLSRASDAQVVLDAEVTLTAEPLDRSGEPQTFPATHANATEAWYYAANVVFPTPGRWRLTVHIDGPESEVSRSFEVQVMPRPFPGFLTYLGAGVLALGLVVVLFIVLKRGSAEDTTEGPDLAQISRRRKHVARARTRAIASKFRLWEICHSEERSDEARPELGRRESRCIRRGT